MTLSVIVSLVARLLISYFYSKPLCPYEPLHHILLKLLNCLFSKSLCLLHMAISAIFSLMTNPLVMFSSKPLCLIFVCSHDLLFWADLLLSVVSTFPTLV